MQVLPLKTPIMKQGDNLYSFLDNLDFELKEEDLFIITAKLFSYHHQLYFSKKESKEELIKKETELGPWQASKNQVPLGLKHKALLPFAGIDESNGNGHYLLLPKEPFQDAKKLYTYLKKRFHIQKLGVIIIDSNLLPLRKGTTAISLGFYGFNPLLNYKGKEDLFGEKLKLTEANIVDSLASFANLYMGEGSESIPCLLLRELKLNLEFSEKNFSKTFFIDSKEDVFSHFFR
jgi:F420-0:gamma-glutamyl ligase